jgi:hypothetical protein
VRQLSATFSKGSDSAPVSVIGGEPKDLDAILSCGRTPWPAPCLRPATTSWSDGPSRPSTR